jgi:hypothetical protein
MCNNHRTLWYNSVASETTLSLPQSSKLLPSAEDIIWLFTWTRSHTEQSTELVIRPPEKLTIEWANRRISIGKSRNTALWFLNSPIHTIDSSSIPYIIRILNTLTFEELKLFISLSDHELSRHDNDIFNLSYEQNCLLMSHLFGNTYAYNYPVWMEKLWKMYSNKKQFDQQKAQIKQKIKTVLHIEWYSTKESYTKKFEELTRQSLQYNTIY